MVEKELPQEAMNTESIANKEGEQFSIEKITNPEQQNEKIKASLELLKNNFPPNEIDDQETIEAAIQGKVVGDLNSSEMPLNIHNVEKDGELAATAHTSALESLDEDKKGNFTGTNEHFLMGHYLAVKESERGKGLGAETLKKVIDDAKAQTPDLKSVIFETGGDDEEFMNKAGLQRLYIEKDDGTLVEVPYEQSVLANNWDKQKGTPQPGKGAEAQHLMMGLLQGENKDISTEELLQKVRAIMDYNSYQTPDYFEGGKRDKKDAFQRHERILDNDLDELAQFLKQSRDGKVKLMTQDERNEFSGKVEEHIKAGIEAKKSANYRDY